MQTAEQVIILSKQAVSCESGGEVVILDIASGQYFALDAIGGEIWKLLESPCTVAELCGRLAQEYAVELARCEADVSTLLGRLAEHGLITFEERGRG